MGNIISISIVAFTIGVVSSLLVAFQKNYVRFNRTNYQSETGNTIWKIITNKGLYGEFLIFEELEKAQGYNKILSNLYLPRKDGSTTEIDLIVINQYGIYVVESKNYSGKIYGKEQYKFWNQYTNRSKNKFYNPVWQNNLHVNALKNVLNPDELEAVHSLIVFSNRSNIDKVEVNKPNIRIIQRKNLLETLNSDRFTLKKAIYLLMR